MSGRALPQAPSAAEEDLEPEDTGGESGPTKPWDPSQIRVNTKTFSLRQAIDEIADGTIDLAPDFQRDYVWKERQRTLLIESILLGIPLPAFYFNASADNSYQVVDGVQRLSTVRDFAGGSFALSEDLEYLTDLAGKRFAQLDAPFKRRFHGTQIVVHVIEPTSPLDLKYDIFRRINTGGSPLTPQEIRHCMSRERSRGLLTRLASKPVFRTSVPLNSTKRMEDRELALRFVAFYRLLAADQSLQRYSTFDTLDAFLLQTTADIDEPTRTSDKDLKDIERAFERGLGNAVIVFGDHAFRKWPHGSDRYAPINRALFDVWAVTLAGISEASAKQKATEIREGARKAMDDSAFVRSVTYGTGKLEPVKTRFQVALGILQEATP
jgi:uncharacterized protein DUF262